MGIDFNGCIELNKEIGIYKDFRIGINGYYYWGDGYRTPKDLNDFNKLMHYLDSHLDSILTGHYFGKLVFVEGDNFGGCNTIIPSEAEYEPSNVYLHPMEFTGVLLAEDVENLCKFVNDYSKTIGRDDIEARITYSNDTYHINDVDYANLIISNSAKIIECVQKYVDKLTPKRKADWLEYGRADVGFDFARTIGINRDFGHRSGFSSNDIDVALVNNIVKMAIDNGQIK